ncbi:MAG: DUF5777 family beta-barrel protein [Bacteroidota bacterium]|nr:DUF5777 family beta-barrel protein [Bacteroidota bacterium]MDP4229939.1 DUF5777 family beta-barrel protein [Bacteroidota bacterium]MDP4235648.1 DUF5777 family beta-barrel protein [Bacteroidota bacterium]
MKKKIACLAFSLAIFGGFAPRMFAQESLLDLVKDTIPQTEYIKNAFKSTRIINGQSIEMLGAGSLDFRILHRFGPINGGPSQLFGLDQSTIRFSFDYAPFNDLLVGFGRSSIKKEYDGSVKYRLIQQSKGARQMPLSVVLVAGVTCETLPFPDQTISNYFTSRLAFFQQVLLGSKLNDDFSVQLSPTLVHRNLVDLKSDPHDIYALGFGGRIRVTNRISFTFDWFHPFNGMKSGLNYDPIAVGFDIETGGHVFQVHLSNSNGMNEKAFITETYNNWLKGGIQLGFNISRMFQL